MFVAVVLALEGGYQLWASKRSGEAKRLAARLRAIESGGRETMLSIERAKPAGSWAWLDRHLIGWLPRGEQLARYLSTSGTTRTVAQLVASTVVLASIGFLVPLLLARPLIFSCLGAFLLAIVPWFRLARQRTLRIRAFEKQIPEALDLMSRAMRAGHAFPTAVQMVGEELADPVRRDQLRHAPAGSAGSARRARAGGGPRLLRGRRADPARVGRQPGGAAGQHREHRAGAPQAPGQRADALGRRAPLGVDSVGAPLRHRGVDQHHHAAVHGSPLDRPHRPAARRCGIGLDDPRRDLDAQDHPDQGLTQEKSMSPGQIGFLVLVFVATFAAAVWLLGRTAGSAANQRLKRVMGLEAGEPGRAPEQWLDRVA